jgi:hypothetical protein
MIRPHHAGGNGAGSGRHLQPSPPHAPTGAACRCCQALDPPQAPLVGTASRTGDFAAGVAEAQLHRPLLRMVLGVNKPTS